MIIERLQSSAGLLAPTGAPTYGGLGKNGNALAVGSRHIHRFLYRLVVTDRSYGGRVSPFVTMARPKNFQGVRSYEPPCSSAHQRRTPRHLSRLLQGGWLSPPHGGVGRRQVYSRPRSFRPNGGDGWPAGRLAGGGISLVPSGEGSHPQVRGGH